MKSGVKRQPHYAKAACSQGAFFAVSELLSRFLLTIKSPDIGTRQRKRYYKALDAHAESMGLRLFCFSQKSGKLYVKSERNSLHIPFKHQYADWLVQLIEKVEQSPNVALDVYETLERLTQSSRATLERMVLYLKQLASKLSFEFFMNGSFLCMKRATQAAQNIPQKGDISTYIEAKDKEKLRNSPKGELRFSSPQQQTNTKMNTNQTAVIIRKKASVLARELKSYFYDNVKVTYNPNMAYKHVEWALKEGFREDDIKASFYDAMIQRHQDATDQGLSENTPKLKYELSSTVSLAKTFLRERLDEGSINQWTPSAEKKTYAKKEKRLDYRESIEVSDTANAEFREFSPKANPIDRIYEILSQNREFERARQYLRLEKTAEASRLLHLTQRFSQSQYSVLRREYLKTIVPSTSTASIKCI